MKRRAFLLSALVLGGCAQLPPMSAGLSRPALRDFSLEGRFALRVERPGEAAQSASGRLSWRHENGGDRVLISSPLGSGIANLEIGALARLMLADGQVRESPDADRLLSEMTGYALPVSRLPAWLLGRTDGRGRLNLDAAGRPARLFEEGWRVDYSYADEAPDALPDRLIVTREGELELRLRIESWSDLP